MMNRITILLLLLAVVIVDSGNDTITTTNYNYNNNNSNNHHRLTRSSNRPHNGIGIINNSTHINRSSNTPTAAPVPPSTSPLTSTPTPSTSSSSTLTAAAAVLPQTQMQQQQQQKRTTENARDTIRDKRGAGEYQLDASELARQNQITQQIFANYLERRLFPNRSTNQKIPTIDDILPKPSTTSRPRPRGFASSQHLKRGIGSRVRYNQATGTTSTESKNQRYRNRHQQLVEDTVDDDDSVASSLYRHSTHDSTHDSTNDSIDDEVEVDGQESLQSVESEQHEYYGDVFNRDPSENEIDSDCPNCVDDTQYTNKWTMPLLKLGEKRYYLGIFFKANWFKATQYCRYHGMHLASISSQEENDRLEKHIRDFGLGHEHFWISGTDLADEGNFFWMATGRPITFTNWNAGEPNNFRYENGEEENCLELWNRDGKGLKWNDSPCSFETYFVCEVQAN